MGVAWELAENQEGQFGYTTLFRSKTLGRNLRAVGYAGSQASGGGAVPSGQTGAPREKANLGFAEAGFEKRSKNLVLRGGAVAGARIEGVVGVDAVGYGG